MNPSEPFLGYHPDAELVIALVCPFGTEYKSVVDTMSNYLRQFGYQVNPIRLSDLFGDLLIKFGEPWDLPSGVAEQAAYKIEAGNRIRQRSQRNDMLSLVAASLIANRRQADAESIGDPHGFADSWRRPMAKTAHVLLTLKRPEEVTTLRRIYGSGFFLIGVSTPRDRRDKYFSELGLSRQVSMELIETDASESKEYGQLTRETFHLADVFVSMDDYGPQLQRFLDLLFGCPTITPTAQEHSMFMAYSASLRSGDLSRQVGAAIVDSTGDLLAVGCNEVPKPGGGQYGPEPGSRRDIECGEDSNEIEKTQMIQRVLTALNREELSLAESRRVLKSTGLTDLTEFGRAVHAEMEALLACARTGRSTRGATLYSTTFPCHNCCRHIIASGIQRVVYIEPYPKSKAPVLHGDAISVDEPSQAKVPFLPFIGVGPRRFFDLFSLKLSTGYPIERKYDGKVAPWTRESAPLRLQLQPASYIERERLAWESVQDLVSRRND